MPRRGPDHRSTRTESHEDRGGRGRDVGTKDVGDHAEDAADQARRSTVVDAGVRLGYLAYALVHFVVAWVALQLAFGDSSGTASSTGALTQLAGGAWGMVLLLVMTGGFVILVLWRLLRAAVGHDDEDGGARYRKGAADVFKAVLYGSLAWSAASIALGGGSGGSGGGSSTDGTTAQLMSLPAGQVLVGAVGAAIAGYGVALAYRGISESFTDDLRTEGKTGDVGRAVVLLGKVGYLAKGVALGLVGVLFGWAAVTHDAQKSGGLDQALHRLLQAPLGLPLLVLVALGIGCYGVFCLARARHMAV